MKIEGRIVSAWPESCSGPGWSNQILHVYSEHPMTGKVIETVLTPREIPKAMLLLWNIVEEVNKLMVEILEKYQREATNED